MESTTDQSNSNDKKQINDNGFFGKCREMMDLFFSGEKSNCSMSECMSTFAKKMKGEKSDPNSEKSSNRCCG